MKKIIAFLHWDKLKSFLYGWSLCFSALSGIFGILASFFGDDLAAAFSLSVGAFSLAGSRFYECKSPSPEGENK